MPGQQELPPPGLLFRPLHEPVHANIRVPHTAMRLQHVGQGAGAGFHDILVIGDETFHVEGNLFAQRGFVDSGDLEVKNCLVVTKLSLR